jgi:3-phosphoshikimate 1-carboxyvinyltransferase
VIFGVKELKVKETDRINSMVVNLKAVGVNIWAGPTKNKRGYDDYAIIIEGLNPFKAAKFKSFGDHRTAMSMIVLGMASGAKHTIDEVRCITKSFPGFIPAVSKLYENC